MSKLYCSTCGERLYPSRQHVINANGRAGKLRTMALPCAKCCTDARDEGFRSGWKYCMEHVQQEVDTGHIPGRPLATIVDDGCGHTQTNHEILMGTAARRGKVDQAAD